MIILLCILITMFLLRRRRFNKAEEQDKKLQAPATVAMHAADMAHTAQEMVVEHFLKVFKAQKGAGEDT